MTREVKFRPISKDEDFEFLTQLLHRAYKKWADQGLRFVATYQTSEKTKQRCAEGHTIIAELDGKVIGLVTVNDHENSFGVEWYEKPGITSFHQFAIDPDYQQLGLGSQLLKQAEEYAKKLGHTELALDTSEKATELIEYYRRKGYRKVDEIKWDHTNYASVVLSKTLL